MAVSCASSPVPVKSPALRLDYFESCPKHTPQESIHQQSIWRSLSSDGSLPVFDLGPFLNSTGKQNEESEELCSGVATCLRDTGCLIVRDPRVAVTDSEKFLDLMEQYFSQSHDAKMVDTRPEVFYQVGATPPGVEIPRSAADSSALPHAFLPGNQPVVPEGADPKWRFMWRVGPRPANTNFPEMNAEPVIPKGFEEIWATILDDWGKKMLAVVHTVADMAAYGFGLPPGTFTDRMKKGPHLLAPTGANLAELNSAGACIAGYHSDLNFLTIHGKSRFPGLHIWLRDGRRVPVSIPDGCLLLQAGQQFEWLTAGYVKAGMHEVVCTEATLAAVDEARKKARSLWRVSSTVFAHVASDEELAPLGHFQQQQGSESYPPTFAGDQVARELERIGLKLD
eukprot:jgi/Botrbrau1/14744/Bobra.0108s0087.1